MPTIIGFAGDTECNVALDDLLGSGTPTTVYFALFTAAPTSAGGGAEAVGYASRPSLANNGTNFPAASGKTKSNGTEIDFGTWAAGETIVWAACVKTSSGVLGPDDIVTAGPLSAPRIMVAGGTLAVPVGGMIFTAQ